MYHCRANSEAMTFFSIISLCIPSIDDTQRHHSSWLKRAETAQQLR
jgi:hypothetical protein